MYLNPLLVSELDQLTAPCGLSDLDLPRTIQRLEDAATLAVRSLMGWKLTLTLDGYDVALTSVHPWVTTDDIHSSLSLALDVAEVGVDGHLVLYAARLDAFTLPVDQLRNFGAQSEEPRVDADLPLHLVPGLTGVAELSTVNVALGVLIGRGRTLATAHHELGDLAAAANINVPEAAARLLLEGQGSSTQL